MDEHLKDELVQRFRQYLDSDFVPGSRDEDIDWMKLFKELAGLKNEVRLESRQLKGALDDFRQAFTSLDEGRQEMIGLLRQNGRQTSEEIEPALSGLIDLHDRIEAGLRQEPPPASLLEKLPAGPRRTRQWLQRHLQGQHMLLSRVLELLAQYGVSPMNIKGKFFDPATMKAVGFTSEMQLDEGLVLDEERKGFQRQEKIVRPAEVVVNKKGI